MSVDEDDPLLGGSTNPIVKQTEAKRTAASGGQVIGQTGFVATGGSGSQATQYGSSPTFQSNALGGDLAGLVQPEEDFWQVLDIPSTIARSVKLNVGGKSVELGMMLAKFFTLPPDQLERLQRGLWERGLYGSSYYSTRTGTPGDQPQFGTPDEDSYEAYRKAMLRAARKQLAERLQGGAAQTAVAGMPSAVASVGAGPGLVGDIINQPVNPLGAVAGG